MNGSVYKSAEGQNIVETAYRVHLSSAMAAGLTQRMVDTGYGHTFVIEKSAPGKPPLVLLHGSASNSAVWLGIIPVYARDFSVYCLDIPGEPGLSSPERLTLASDAPVCWLENVLDALGLHKCFFVGMSLGGWYALNFAVHDPGRVYALSLISGGGIARQKPGFIVKALFFIMLGPMGKKLLNKLIYHKVVVPKEILEYQSLVSEYFRPVTESLPMFTDEQLSALAMPLQYFGGDHDSLLDTRKAVARLSALLPHSEARLLEDTGHAIIDKFEETREFLTRHIR
jgi:pimeloyl-ACP methyl ester carboxylesterase